MTADPHAPRRRRGFERAATLVEDRIRAAGESRGFAVARVLTHWAEIAGVDIAAVARPVRLGYGRTGLGATLTILTTGAHAPILAMRSEDIRARVNACYGYNAVSRIRITQTAPEGFAEARAGYDPGAAPSARPDPAALRAAADLSAGVGDADLRGALEEMGRTLLSRPTP